MIILDTDVLTLLMLDAPVAQPLIARLEALPTQEVATTIISFEEQMRGWLSRIARSRSIADQVTSYRRLNRQLEGYCRLLVLDFDAVAAAEYQRFRQSRVRISSMDLKIAAISLARGATLVTRNLGDFGKVAGLRAEDWVADQEPPG